MEAPFVLARKFGHLLLGRYSTIQILQRVNRTPLRHVVKAAVTLTDLAGKRRRRHYAGSLPRTTEADDLCSSGFCRPAVDAGLFNELHATAYRLWRDIGADRQRRSNKSYLKAFIANDLEAGRIDSASIFIRCAAQPSIVDTVAKYFGEAPYLSYVALDLSEYAGEQLSTSQLWHRDYDDTKVVKLFVYLTDVLEDADGPFTFIPPSASKSVRGTAVATHLADERVFRSISRDVAVRIRAPCGTVFLVDTGRCYHMGSRVAPGHKRLMFTACYITRPAIYPHFLNTITVREALGPREKFLLLP